LTSVYIAGQVLKKLLRTYTDKVDGQQAVAEKKANLIYSALEAHPEVYKIVPEKSVRSKMNICFRVTKVCIAPIEIFLAKRDPDSDIERKCRRGRKGVPQRGHQPAFDWSQGASQRRRHQSEQLQLDSSGRSREARQVH